MPHSAQYLDIYSRDEILTEFIRRVEWSYQFKVVSLVPLDNGLYFAWVSNDSPFEGAIETSGGHWQKRVFPCEFGM